MDLQPDHCSGASQQKGPHFRVRLSRGERQRASPAQDSAAALAGRMLKSAAQGERDPDRLRDAALDFAA